MAHNARVEEISDSDPEEMDISDFFPPQAALSSLINPTNIPTSSLEPQLQPQFRAPPSQTAERERTKHWQCIYPIYFDSTRTRAEGRRVGKEQAVPNPLAREIVDAVQMLGLQVAFEPGKMHPKDWANPGRVRVLLKENDEKVAHNVKNKHHLYTLISQYLRDNPTKSETPLRLRIMGMPHPTEPPQPPAIPRGWKMNTILPLHSPALTGGGVSENFLKDMMAEMQGQAAGGLEGPSGAPKKKDKKKGKS